MGLNEGEKNKLGSDFGQFFFFGGGRGQKPILTIFDENFHAG
jgi:hypothetical protein